MNRNSNIEKEVEATMNCLDDLRQASPGPFFYTRVLARLNKTEKTVWENVTALISKPLVAFSVICFVIAMNMVAVLQPGSKPTVVADQSVELSAYDEFNLAANTFYDYETPEP